MPDKNVPAEAPEEEKAERKQTKYDLKMERRAAEKKKEARDELVFNVFGICVILALVIFIASFPIRSYMAVHKTICTVDDQAISQVKFDYYYNTVKANYMQNYGSYLTYYGVNSDADLSTVMYDDTLTFEQYFQEMAMDQIKQNAALLKEANAAGFTADVDKEYADYLADVRKAVEESAQTEKEFYQTSFGTYATVGRLESIVKESILVNAYYDEKYESLRPEEAEINAYYEEHKSDYDDVTYRVSSAAAELPTAPTELADEGATVAEDGTYTPSEAEVAAAMEIAKGEADRLLETIATDGELMENVTRSAAAYVLRDWLFDEARVAGDSTVIENTSGNSYYVVEFESRQRDDAPTSDVRVIVTQEDNGAAILEEYRAAGATEAAFLDLIDSYSVDKTTEGGLYEGQSAAGMSEDMNAWMTDPARQTGDVNSFYLEDAGITYVVYYLNQNKPGWYMDIRTVLTNQAMSDYVAGITDAVTLSDPNGNLEYLKLREQKEAEEAAAAETEEPAAETEAPAEGSADTAQ